MCTAKPCACDDETPIPASVGGLYVLGNGECVLVVEAGEGVAIKAGDGAL